MGNEQVTRRRIEGMPSWVAEKSVRTEHDDNWMDAYDPGREDMVPMDANVISSHVVYKVKKDGDSSLTLKARICPHGDRDTMKDDFRNDSAMAQYCVIPVMLSIASMFKCKLRFVDMKGAYL